MSSSERSAARRWLGTLAVVLVLPTLSVALVVGVFEVGLRLAGHRAIYEIYSKPSVFWEHDELLGWSHQPGASGEYVGPRPWPIEFRAPVSINALGLRGPEIPRTEPDEARVLVLGDSMVAAFEVAYEQTFTAVLEDGLNDATDVPVRVINGGVRGYGTDQSYLYFRERGAALDTDVVVFFYSGNDPSDNTTLHEMRRPFGKAAFALREDGGLELVGAPVPVYPMCAKVELSPSFEVVRVDTLAGRLMCRAQMGLLDHSALFSLLTIAIPWDQDLLGRLYRLGNLQRSAGDDEGSSSAGHDFAERLTTTLVLELADAVRDRGAAFLLIGFPSHLEQLDADRLAERDIEVVRLSALESAPQEEVRWRRDSHLNPEGHRRLAARIHPHVVSKLRSALARAR